MKNFSIWCLDPEGNLIQVSRLDKDEENAESVLIRADQSREKLWKRIKQSIDKDDS